MTLDATAMPVAIDSQVDLLVARQPLFDRTLDVVGYELLYRDSVARDEAGSLDPSLMTNITLANAVLGIGLEELVGRTHAWVNVPQELLEQDVWSVLDPAQYVLEILEDTAATESVMAAMQRAREAGFRLALDDFLPQGPTAPLTHLAHIVKLEMTMPADCLADTVRDLRRRRALTLVAEKVETPAEFEFAYELGFDLFQGWHFGRAETVSGRDMPPVITAVATVMQRLRNTAASDAYVEAGFHADPTLMIKLLRLANSAAYGFHGVTSARKALQLVGRDALYQWLAILLVASIPRRSGVDEERLRLALERARFCEVIGGYVRHGQDASPFFLSGLLSLLDTLMGVPLDVILDRVHAPDAVRAALLDGEGQLARVLQLAEAVEHARFADARDLASTLGVSAHLRESIADSTRWADGIRASLT